MNPEVLAIRVQWTWGGSKVVHAWSFSPIDEVLGANGFDLSRACVLVAFKGSIINTALSFHHYKIANGDRLVCCARKSPRRTNRRPIRWCHAFNERPLPHTTVDSDFEYVRARLHDMAFAQWETGKEVTNMMQELLKQEEKRRTDVPLVQFTILSHRGAIGESPLPTLWQFESLHRQELQ